MNYEVMGISHQRGAVLAFSLVMLLLLTLVSVSMIQQNKQELAMAGNTLEQTKSLARAETDLAQAQQFIDETRLNPNASPPYSDRRCNIASQVDKDEVIVESATGKATVTGVYCLTSTTETECTYTNGVRDDIFACRCKDNAEVYIIKWESIADVSGYGAQRTVESKYAVNCSGGGF
ncbi:MAG: hypothetical protein EPN17_16930 [Methylobacter sp.]|nr:MAG: hypothetical protein EPN17_16930 [Methylobacter sp.]